MTEKSINSDKILGADIVVDSDSARQNATIKSFVDIMVPRMVSGCVPFGFLQAPEIMPAWSRMVISRFDTCVGDFRHIFVGTDVVAAYGVDFTGTLIDAHPEEEEGITLLRKIRTGVMKNREIAYYSGAVLNKDYHAKSWDAANMPYVYAEDDAPAGTVSILSYF